MSAEPGALIARAASPASGLAAAGSDGISGQPEGRFKHFLFGADYYPEHWPETYWEDDARRMKECGVNAVRMGEFAWALMEREEGKYDFSLFDRAIAVLSQHGIGVIFGTPTAAPPKWLTHDYPEVLLVKADGRPADDQSRRHYCYNSPKYREFSRNIVTALASHFKDNAGIIGWQIDNEINCEYSTCYSESCAIAFRKWLQGKYGTLGGLNDRWGTAFWSQLYTDWDQINLPRPTVAIHNPALMLDYRRFISDSATSFLNEQVSIIRRYRPNDFITSNGVFDNINYYDFSSKLDLYAQDNYPCFLEQPQYQIGADLTAVRDFNGRMMIMEEQTGPAGQTYLLRTPKPGEMNLWAFQTIAHGADGVLHFRWRGARRGAEEYWFGVLDQDNVPRARFEEFKKEGGEINRIAPEVFGSAVRSDIAAIKDYDDEWAYSHQYLTREVNINSEFVQLFRAASELKYNIDFISPAADFSRYKVIFGPSLVIMDPALAKKIEDFVRAGGIFIMSAHSAVKTRDNAMTDETIPILVGKVFGIEATSFTDYPPPSAEKNSIDFKDGSTAPVDAFADILTPKGASVIATWERDYMKGSPACTENGYGSGKAVYYGSFFNIEATRSLMAHYAAAAGLTPLLPGIPREVEVTRRSKGALDFYFILNHSGRPVRVSPGAGFLDMIARAAAPESFTLGPYEYRVLKKSSGDR